MTPDDGISRAPQEGERQFSFEEELESRETVIINNETAIKFASFGYVNGEGNWVSGKRIKVICPKDQKVQIYRDGELITLEPVSIKDNYQTVKLDLFDNANDFNVGDYSISSEIIQTMRGHGVSLRVDSPAPMGHAIVAGIHTQKMRTALIAEYSRKRIN